jgi:hypothetical protein
MFIKALPAVATLVFAVSAGGNMQIASGSASTHVSTTPDRIASSFGSTAEKAKLVTPLCQMAAGNEGGEGGAERIT